MTDRFFGWTIDLSVVPHPETWVRREDEYGEYFVPAEVQEEMEKISSEVCQVNRS